MYVGPKATWKQWCRAFHNRESLLRSCLDARGRGGSLAPTRVGALRGDLPGMEATKLEKIGEGRMVWCTRRKIASLERSALKKIRLDAED